MKGSMHRIRECEASLKTILMFVAWLLSPIAGSAQTRSSDTRLEALIRQVRSEAKIGYLTSATEDPLKVKRLSLHSQPSLVKT